MVHSGDQLSQPSYLNEGETYTFDTEKVKHTDHQVCTDPIRSGPIHRFEPYCGNQTIQVRRSGPTQ